MNQGRISGHDDTDNKHIPENRGASSAKDEAVGDRFNFDEDRLKTMLDNLSPKSRFYLEGLLESILKGY